MKTLIVFVSKYGTTEKCANLLAEKLKGQCDLFNLKNKMTINFDEYDKIVIGGPIYIGRIKKEITEFCLTNIKTLKGKKLGLFICNMREGADAEEQLNNAFPQELYSNAIAKGYFGGEFIISNMGFVDKFITKTIAKADKNTSNILYDNIEKFAQNMNNY